jgi:hypothetical protein
MLYNFQDFFYCLSSQELPNVMHSKILDSIQLCNPVEEEVGPQTQILVPNLEEDNKTLHPVQNNELPPLADNFLLWINIKIA